MVKEFTERYNVNCLNVKMYACTVYALRSNLSSKKYSMKTVNKFNVNCWVLYTLYAGWKFFGNGISKVVYYYVHCSESEELIKHNLFFINCIKRRKYCLNVDFFMCGELNISHAKSKLTQFYCIWTSVVDANGVLCECKVTLAQSVNQNWCRELFIMACALDFFIGMLLVTQQKCHHHQQTPPRQHHNHGYCCNLSCNSWTHWIWWMHGIKTSTSLWHLFHRQFKPSSSSSSNTPHKHTHHHIYNI